MPESVTDRPTRAHEYIFLLSKSKRYYYDADAIRHPGPRQWHGGGSGLPGNAGAHYGPSRSNGGLRQRRTDKQRGHSRRHAGFNDRWDAMSKEEQSAMGANCRDVWLIATQPYPGAHFAVFPEEIPRRCILAGSKPGDTVLDPFAGSGTTLYVAKQLERRGIGIELNTEYEASLEPVLIPSLKVYSVSRVIRA